MFRQNIKRLVDVAKECVELGLAQVKPWGHLGDVADAISKQCKGKWLFCST